MRARDPELDHGRPEVVEVLVQARLRVHADHEVLDGLVGERRGLDAQRVQVVGDRAAVAVLGQVADGEVHACTGRAAGCAGLPKYRWAMSRSTRASSCWTSPSVSRDRRVGHRRAGAEVEVGHQPREPQDGRRAAVGRVGRGQRGVQRLDREGHRVRVVALEQQEARDRPRVRAARAPSAGRPESRRRPAAAPAPGRRAGGCPRPRPSAAPRAASAAPCPRTRSPRPPAGRRAPRRAASCARSRPRTARSARARTRRRCTGRSARPRRCCAAAGRGGRC